MIGVWHAVYTRWPLTNSNQLPPVEHLDLISNAETKTWIPCYGLIKNRLGDVKVMSVFTFNLLKLFAYKMSIAGEYFKMLSGVFFWTSLRYHKIKEFYCG